MKKLRRQTKVIATVGPASESEDMLEELIREGVDVFRLVTPDGARGQDRVAAHVETARLEAGRERAADAGHFPRSRADGGTADRRRGRVTLGGRILGTL